MRPLLQPTPTQAESAASWQGSDDTEAHRTPRRGARPRFPKCGSDSRLCRCQSWEDDPRRQVPGGPDIDSPRASQQVSGPGGTRLPRVPGCVSSALLARGVLSPSHTWEPLLLPLGGLVLGQSQAVLASSRGQPGAALGSHSTKPWRKLHPVLGSMHFRLASPGCASEEDSCRAGWFQVGR